MSSEDTLQRFATWIGSRAFVEADGLLTDARLVHQAFDQVVADVRYFDVGASSAAVLHSVVGNRRELAVFLYRLGRAIWETDQTSTSLDVVHGQMRELCACEIYFNNEIGEGLRIVHGLGTVIGSRNRIGKGFTVHHNCTVGHRRIGGGGGNQIGDDVTCFAGAMIVGDSHVGDGAVIGANAVVLGPVGAGDVVRSPGAHRPPRT